MKGLQFIVFFLIALIFVEVSQADEAGEIVPMKRPFCNAFSGCGKKRDPAYAAPIVGENSLNQQPISLLYRALRLVPSRNAAIAEWRLRQRLAEEAALDSLEQMQQPMLSRINLY